MQPTTLLSVLLLPVLASAQYQMVKEYVGDNFFNDWTFYNNCESFLSAPLTHRGRANAYLAQTTT